MKIINPDDYVEILENSYCDSNISVPLFTTGFADIITWEESKYVVIVNYRKTETHIHPLNFNRFLTFYDSSKIYMDFLDSNQYNNAIQLLGKLEYDECFGYVPLLAFGGSEKVENLQKIKLLPHIDIMAQASGRIE